MKKRSTAIKTSPGDRVFYGIIFILAVVFLIVFIYPMLYVFVSSFSGGAMISGLSLIPKQVTLEGYKAVMEHEYVLRGYVNSMIYMVVGTCIAMIVPILCAYPLSRRDFKRGKYFLGLCLFTMYFEGGLIPTYLWMRSLNLLDTMWAIILPPALSIYNMLVMRTYFSTQIPDEMREAAQIDGCNSIQVLWYVGVPILKPAIISVALFQFMWSMNDFIGPLIYVYSVDKYPIALALKMSIDVTEGAPWNEILAMASISILPSIIVFFLAQRYFVQGVTSSGIKG